ncbi:MAG: DUF1573 domain-containing protein [Phycisphaerales bacterium]
MRNTTLTLLLVAGLALPALAQQPTPLAPTGTPTPVTPPSTPVPKPAQMTPEEMVKAKQKAIAEEFSRKQAEAVQAATGPQGIRFDNATPDLGKVSDETPVPYKFTFANISDKTVTITNVTPGCGCTATNFTTMKKTYAPGEKGELEITFNPAGKRGLETKHVQIDTDFTAAPRVELNFKVDIKPRVMIEPPSIAMMEVRKGAAGKQVLYVTGRQPGFEVTKMDLADPDFTVTRLDKTEIPDGDETLTRIGFEISSSTTLPITGANRKAAMLNLTTNDPKKSLIPVGVQISVVGPARLLPDRIPLRVTSPGEAWAREVRIDNRDGKPFDILDVQTDAPADMRVVLDTEPNPAGMAVGHRIKLAGVAPATPGAINAKVMVRTNLPDQEYIEIPIMGIMAVNTAGGAPNNIVTPIPAPTPTGAAMTIPSKNAGGAPIVVTPIAAPPFAQKPGDLQKPGSPKAPANPTAPAPK